MPGAPILPRSMDGRFCRQARGAPANLRTALMAAVRLLRYFRERAMPRTFAAKARCAFSLPTMLSALASKQSRITGQVPRSRRQDDGDYHASKPRALRLDAEYDGAGAVARLFISRFLASADARRFRHSFEQAATSYPHAAVFDSRRGCWRISFGVISDISLPSITMEPQCGGRRRSANVTTRSCRGRRRTAGSLKMMGQ